MRFTQLLLAASASAFLVVPDVPEKEDGIFRTLPVDGETYEVPEIALVQSLEVPCPECRGRDTFLKLDFAVEDSKRLVLNGFELYPNPDPWQGDLTAAVVKSNGKSKDRTLGYGLAVRREGTDEDQKLEVIGLELLVIEVGDRFVDGIPPVYIKLVKALTGDILIGSISMNGMREVDSEGQCATLWCQVSSLFEDAWSGVKTKFKGMGCHGKNAHGKGHGHHGHHGHKGQHHGQNESAHEQEQDLKHHGHKSNGHHGKFSHKHHHHREKAWSIVKHVASYIILPVIMGMTAGVLFAIVCMFICTLFVRVFRGERREVPVYADEKIAITEFLASEEETAHLMEAHDEPPKYEDRELQ